MLWELSNLTLVHFEEKMSCYFTTDLSHRFIPQFNIQDFYKIMNQLDPDLQFIYLIWFQFIWFIYFYLQIIYFRRTYLKHEFYLNKS